MEVNSTPSLGTSPEPPLFSLKKKKKQKHKGRKVLYITSACSAHTESILMNETTTVYSDSIFIWSRFLSLVQKCRIQKNLPFLLKRKIPRTRTDLNFELAFRRHDPVCPPPAPIAQVFAGKINLNLFTLANVQFDLFEPS